VKFRGDAVAADNSTRIFSLNLSHLSYRVLGLLPSVPFLLISSSPQFNSGVNRRRHRRKRSWRSVTEGTGLRDNRENVVKGVGRKVLSKTRATAEDSLISISNFSLACTERNLRNALMHNMYTIMHKYVHGKNGFAERSKILARYRSEM